MAYGSGRSIAASIGAEDRRGGADAETDRHDDRQRQHRHAQQAADADAKVLHEILEHQRALHYRLPCFILLAAIPPRRLEIAELPHRLRARLIARHPRATSSSIAHLDVEVQLFIDIRLHRCAAADTRMASSAPVPLPLPVTFMLAPCSTASTARA